MPDLTGWLLDVYAAPEGVRLWLLGDDGQRRCLHQPFPVTFYAAGDFARLRRLWRFLQDRPGVRLARTERRDLFAGLLPVLAVQASHPEASPPLFQQALAAFPDLTYYDADVPLALRYAAEFGVFPLARCRVQHAGGQVLRIEPLDSPWDLEPDPPPLRLLALEPDEDPAHRPPAFLNIRAERQSYRLFLHPRRPLLLNLAAILKRHDPDLLLTAWGDTWLLPRWLEWARELGLPAPLNRDPEQEVEQHAEGSYFSYGQVVYRGAQTFLFGRWHVDRHNSMLWGDYSLDGVLEMARVTSLGLQTAARVSPGTGISAMQMLTALRQGILVPWRKQQAERPKPASEIFAADQGGLVYQPVIGLHRDVGAIDFISMYPGIMVRFNISPEVVGSRLEAEAACPPQEAANRLLEQEAAGPVPQTPGLVPQTLAPLLHKRVTLKRRVAELPRWDPRRRLFQARSSAHKWLLVTCFGYLGYKNARFGRIEAHEAVTAYGREALLRAKETAEDLGFTVLHMYVDGLWVQKEGASAPQDFRPLLESIVERTGLPIALDGVYRWVAFLPSRADRRVPVPNRYFGVFQDGSLKIRGIEARRRDTPAFIEETQLAILERLAQAPSAVHLPEYLPQVRALVRQRIADLRRGRVPLKKLLVGQRLSRELEGYRTPPPAARAAAQMQAAGLPPLRPGQRVRFLYTRGDPGVYAWDLPEPPNPATIDVAHYIELLRRAVETVLEGVGLGTFATGIENVRALPLFESRCRLKVG